jgi:chromosome partitioning protein
MRVIVLASQKGGAGKSTLVSHLSVQAHRSGDGPVGVFDLDPQGSLSDWINERKADWPLFYKVGRGGIAGALSELRAEGKVKLVIIDTPGAAATPAIVSILGLADLVVVPVVPSPQDIRAIGNTLDAIEEAGRPMVMVLSIAPPTGMVLTHEVSSNLSQYGTVAPVAVRMRTDYRTSMTDGRVAVELKPNSKSAHEISELWAYLNTRLKKQEQKHGRARSVA